MGALLIKRLKPSLNKTRPFTRNEVASAHVPLRGAMYKQYYSHEKCPVL